MIKSFLIWYRFLQEIVKGKNPIFVYYCKEAVSSDFILISLFCCAQPQVLRSRIPPA